MATHVLYLVLVSLHMSDIGSVSYGPLQSSGDREGCRSHRSQKSFQDACHALSSRCNHRNRRSSALRGGPKGGRPDTQSGEACCPPFTEHYSKQSQVYVLWLVLIRLAAGMLRLRATMQARKPTAQAAAAAAAAAEEASSMSWRTERLTRHALQPHSVKCCKWQSHPICGDGRCHRTWETCCSLHVGVLVLDLTRNGRMLLQAS